MVLLKVGDVQEGLLGHVLNAGFPFDGFLILDRMFSVEALFLSSIIDLFGS